MGFITDHSFPPFERDYQSVRRFFRARLRASDWVEDLVQDTFVRVLAARRVRPVSSPRAFLLQTASNLLIDFHRRARSRESVIDSEADVETAPVASEPLDETMARYGDLARLKRAIEGLPPKCRQVFVLHKLEGYSHGEIAGRFGLSREAVEKHIVRAMARLRQTLTADLG